MSQSCLILSFDSRRARNCTNGEVQLRREPSLKHSFDRSELTGPTGEIGNGTHRHQFQKHDFQAMEGCVSLASGVKRWL